MASTADFRTGMVIEAEGQLFTLVEFQHVKPGKGGAFVRTKLKNVLSGAVIDRTYRSGESITEVRLDRRKMQYLYSTDDMFYVMDTENYEQLSLPEVMFRQVKGYLKDNMDIQVLFNKEQALSVEIPLFVTLKVVETEPGYKGDTASSVYKPATTETGLIVQVPLFINQGDTLKIDTRTGKYLERA